MPCLSIRWLYPSIPNLRMSSLTTAYMVHSGTQLRIIGGRLVIAADRKLPPEALSDFDFLLEANATRVGNLDFRRSPDSPEPELAPPSFNRLTDILDSAAKIEAGEEVSPHIYDLMRQGTSVGGARPKCTVEWEESLWIAKCPRQG